MLDKQVTIKYISTIAVAVFFTWMVHELTHWLTYFYFGFEAKMTLNTVSVLNDGNLTSFQENITSINGPLITILQAILVFIYLYYKKWNKYFYPFLFIPFYMRFLAGLFNFSNPNDEGRVSEFLGIGLFTISIIVTGFLLFLVIKISKKYKLNWKFHVKTTFIVMFFSSVLILLDQFIEIRLL